MCFVGFLGENLMTLAICDNAYGLSAGIHDLTLEELEWIGAGSVASVATHVATVAGIVGAGAGMSILASGGVAGPVSGPVAIGAAIVGGSALVVAGVADMLGV